MKKFFCVQIVILIAALAANFFSKKLIPNHIICRNVDEIPFNAVLSSAEVSMQDTEQDAQELISNMRDIALEEKLQFTVATVEAESIRLVSNGNCVISCRIHDVYEGNEEFSEKSYNIFLRPQSAFVLLEKSDFEQYLNSIPPEIAESQSAQIEQIKNSRCFYYSNTNIPLPGHQYLAFLESGKLSDSSQEYIFFLDYYDLADTKSVPVAEGSYGMYQDYADNEVFYSAQEDIDLYYQLKDSILSAYIKK